MHENEDNLLEKASPLKRQQTMRQEQTENFFEEDKEQQERDHRISSPKAGLVKRRKTQDHHQIANTDENGFMVVGQGYSKETR